MAFQVSYLLCVMLGMTLGDQDVSTSDVVNSSKDDFPPLPSLEQVREEILRGHNSKRALHGASPLKINETLNSYAQTFAESLAKTNRFYSTEPYGENVYWSTVKKVTPDDAINKWYAGSAFFNYNSEQYDEKSSGFTQLVWKNSTDLGVGIARNETRGYTYIVASYYPMGNVAGEYKDNVLRSGSRRRLLRH
jgi:uncharacterized protein YkwD